MPSLLLLPSAFPSLKSKLWDSFEILPIKRVGEHGRENSGGGYGIRRGENLAWMGAYGQGENWQGLSLWPSLCVVPEAVICDAPDAPIGMAFVILAGTRSALMWREKQARWQCGEPAAEAVGRPTHW